ncbi:B3/4 domain-containing protein [Paraburkholderia denitrificans]|uniref:B3/4 domain-containing protein n=1 Tax=Paraburkholderia denitrificans TaxID=694025 RepID=A0ABW0J9F6_9BURK
MATVVRGVADLKPDQVDIAATLECVCRRLDGAQESEFPSIQAWRRTYAAAGIKPTQYRCAAEALLRRFRKERVLSRLHPLVDVLNAESMRAAIPIAAFDIAHVVEGITVRHATGEEIHETFTGEAECPAKEEIVFADTAGQAHSRRWAYRQSAVSAVSERSNNVLIIAEALHEEALADLMALQSRLKVYAEALNITIGESAFLTPDNRRFDFAPTEANSSSSNTQGQRGET